MAMKKLKRQRKKGFIFTLDGLFASMLIIGGLLLISSFHVDEPQTKSIDFVSKDIITVLSKMHIKDINATNAFVQNETANGNITKLNNTVMEQIGEFWATGYTDLASGLAFSVLDGIIPDRYGMNLTFGPDQIYYKAKNTANVNDLIISRRMISGVAKGAELEGSTSTAFLKSIVNKPSSSYVYFGGFVGQGNISVFINNVPDDVNPSDVTSIIMEVDAASTMSLYINNILCENSLTPVTANATADTWDLTHCNTSIQPGINTFDIYFTDLDDSYIAGGFIRVDYRTNQFQANKSINISRYYLPGITGIINLYDAMYMAGNVVNMTVYLHYIANHSDNNNTFYMTIGNQTVFLENYTNTTQYVTLTDINLTQLNYSAFNFSTVPFRIGFQNLTFRSSDDGGEGFGDIFLITDRSGSMDWEFNSNDEGDERFCTDSQLYEDTTQRLSVAKCVEYIFVDQILENTTLNRIGLSSYGTFVDPDYEPLTNDGDRLKYNISLYEPNLSSTCVSCGVYQAIMRLLDPPPAQLHIDRWNYYQEWQYNNPDADWYEVDYDDSLWETGFTGFGYGMPANTTIGNYNSPADLWEHGLDTNGMPNDFDGGTFNQTGNTFGLGGMGSDDGWDSSDGGIYGGDGNRVYIDNLVNMGGGDYEAQITISGPSTSNPYPHETGAGAYGIQVNVTDELYQIIQDGGYAVFSFDYTYDDDGNWESSDQIWIKSRITNTTGTSTYLGSNLDDYGLPTAHTGADDTFEVYTDDDPDYGSGAVYEGSFNQELTEFITEPGHYYLDFGAKAYRNYYDDDAQFTFDNVQLVFVNTTGNIYFRNSFTLNDLSRFSNARLYVSSDDYVEVYLNEHLLVNDTPAHPSSYWNIDAMIVNMANFSEGENVLAVKLVNDDNQTGYFDLELRADMTQRQKALVIMSDGQANRCHGDADTSWPFIDTNNWGTASSSYTNCNDYRAGNETIEFARYAYEELNMSIYTVFFGNTSYVDGWEVLNDTACVQNCSHYYSSENISGLADVFKDIADTIIDDFGTTSSQVIVTGGGNITHSQLFNDSYIEVVLNETQAVNRPNQIDLVFQTDQFTNCTDTFNISQGLTIKDARITSYSGEHWTDFLEVNGVIVYNLTEYAENYSALGDPYTVEIDPSLLVNGVNTVVLGLGDSESVKFNCSANNSVIYSAYVNSSTARTPVLPGKSGCNWTIQFADGTFKNLSIPESPVPSNLCNYTNASISFNHSDTYDVAVYSLLNQLDFLGDGTILINLDQEDLEIIVFLLSSVPYQWGPAVLEAKVWQ